jgi:hypothetical protein
MRVVLGTATSQNYLAITVNGVEVRIRPIPPTTTALGTTKVGWQQWVNDEWIDIATKELA